RLVLARLELARGEERLGLVEEGAVAGGADVEGDGVGEPEEVVGEAAADAGLGDGVPPVEDVALGELVGGVAADLLAGEVGAGVEERGGVLELVAVAEGAAALVERGAAPEAAREVLVEQPAVGEHVELRERRLDVRGGERLTPEGGDLVERGVRGPGLGEAADDAAGVVLARALAEEERE